MIFSSGGVKVSAQVAEWQRALLLAARTLSPMPKVRIAACEKVASDLVLARFC